MKRKCMQCKVAAAGFLVIQNIADVGNVSDGNDANREALRAHIPIIVSVLQQHFSIAEVTEAGLVTVALYRLYMIHTIYMLALSSIHYNSVIHCFHTIFFKY